MRHTQKTIDPSEWVNLANKLHPSTEGLTAWLPGDVAPVHAGLYERFFTDGKLMQQWDGQHWLATLDKPHWRQVGAYPAWRGASKPLQAGQEIVLLRGSRGRSNGPGHERRVRARLVSASPSIVEAVLLEDDIAATNAPTKAGETGVWHGLSFITEKS